MACKHGFQKKEQPNSCLKGININHDTNQLIISSGISSFDDTIGNNLSLGSLIMFEEDTKINISRFLIKSFLNEGVMNNHQTIYFSYKKINFVDKTPINSAEYTPNKVLDFSIPGGNDLEIAWRYKYLQPSNATYNKISQGGLNTAMFNNSENFKQFHGRNYYDLCDYIKTFYSNKLNHIADNNITYIIIDSFTCDSESTTDIRSLIKILLKLKVLCRSFPIIILIFFKKKTMDSNILKSFIRITDCYIKLESLKDDIKKFENFENYSGLMKVSKINLFNTINPYNYESFVDIGFRWIQKNIVFEKIRFHSKQQNSNSILKSDSSLKSELF